MGPQLSLTTIVKYYCVGTACYYRQVLLCALHTTIVKYWETQGTALALECARPMLAKAKILHMFTEFRIQNFLDFRDSESPYNCDIFTH